MKTIISDFNRDLAGMLGIPVREGYAMTPDETYLEVFYRDEQGYARPIPDFEHDASETIRRLPRSVEMRLRYSPHFEQWVCLLMRDAEIYEGMGDTPDLSGQAIAAARAFKQLLAFDAAAAKQAEKAVTR